LPYQFFRARARFRRALVSKFTILSIDFNGAVQRECFLAAYAWKLMWGLPAAMTEFSLNLTVKFGIQEIVVALFGCRLGRYVWSTFSQGRTNYLLLSSVSRYLFIGLLILNETRKSARMNLPKLVNRALI